MLFMGASSLALAVAFHAMRGMYLHAERLLAKAGVASARGGGSPTLGTKRSGSGKGAAKRRAAQAKRGSLGKPLAGARGGAPECTSHLRYKTDRGPTLHRTQNPDGSYASG